MRKLIWLLILLLLLAACAQNEKTAEPGSTETVTLYYGDAQNESWFNEENYFSQRKIAIRLFSALITAETAGLTNNIPAGTKVYGTMRQENALLVNLTEDFNSFGGSVAETVAIASIVNTLTEFAEIEKVKILVAGSELIGPSGMARGFMTRFNTEAGPPAEQEEVTLYFANPQATALVPEKRSLTFPLDADLETRLRTVLEELIRGPQTDNLAATIPPEVKVLSVEVCRIVLL